MCLVAIFINICFAKFVYTSSHRRCGRSVSFTFILCLLISVVYGVSIYKESNMNK